MCSTTSKVLIDRYLKGRAILFKKPDIRREDELEFLQEWLPENVPLFKETSPGVYVYKQICSHSLILCFLESLRLMIQSMTLLSYFAGEVIYEQDDPVMK